MKPGMEQSKFVAGDIGDRLRPMDGFHSQSMLWPFGKLVRSACCMPSIRPSLRLRLSCSSAISSRLALALAAKPTRRNGDTCAQASASAGRETQSESKSEIIRACQVSRDSRWATLCIGSNYLKIVGSMSHTYFMRYIKGCFCNRWVSFVWSSL